MLDFLDPIRPSDHRSHGKVWGLVMNTSGCPSAAGTSAVWWSWGLMKHKQKGRGPTLSISLQLPLLTASDPSNKPAPGGPHPPSQHSARFAGGLLWATHIGGSGEPYTGTTSQTALETSQLSPSPTAFLSPLSLAWTTRLHPTPPRPFPPPKSPPLEGFLEKTSSARLLPLPQTPWTLRDSAYGT